MYGFTFGLYIYKKQSLLTILSYKEAKNPNLSLSYFIMRCKKNLSIFNTSMIYVFSSIQILSKLHPLHFLDQYKPKSLQANTQPLSSVRQIPKLELDFITFSCFYLSNYLAHTALKLRTLKRPKYKNTRPKTKL